MSTKKQQRAQKRAIIEKAIIEKTHRTVSIKLPIDIISQLKANAREKGKIFSVYMAESAEKGANL